MSSWSEEFEDLMETIGYHDYGCFNKFCNHAAKNTFGMLFHGRFGSHHMNHKTGW